SCAAPRADHARKHHRRYHTRHRGQGQQAALRSGLLRRRDPPRLGHPQAGGRPGHLLDMPYWDVVMRSFRISWNHKYLWLIALFSGEGGGGFSFNYSQPSTGRGASPNFATIQQQVKTWVADHVALIVLLAILWLLMVFVFVILAPVCEVSTVCPSAEYVSDRYVGLGWSTCL